MMRGKERFILLQERINPWSIQKNSAMLKETSELLILRLMIREGSITPPAKVLDTKMTLDILVSKNRIFRGSILF